MEFGKSTHDPKTTMASTAKGGMEPAIIPNKKHQVASILAPLMHMEPRSSGLVQAIAGVDLAIGLAIECQ